VNTPLNKQTDPEQRRRVIPNPFMGEGPMDKFSSNVKMQNKANLLRFQPKNNDAQKNKPNSGLQPKSLYIGITKRTQTRTAIMKMQNKPNLNESLIYRGA
jgi:hypothetical protein